MVAGPHKGQTLTLDTGGAEVRVGRNAPRKNGLRLDKDLEVSDKCVRPAVGRSECVEYRFIMWCCRRVCFFLRRRAVEKFCSSCFAL